MALAGKIPLRDYFDIKSELSFFLLDAAQPRENWNLSSSETLENDANVERGPSQQIMISAQTA